MRKDRIFSYLPSIAGTWRMFLVGWESTGIFQEGPRSISLSCAQLGPSAAAATSMRAPCCWASTVNLGLLPSLLFLLFAPQRQSRGIKSCFCKAL